MGDTREASRQHIRGCSSATAGSWQAPGRQLAGRQLRDGCTTGLPHAPQTTPLPPPTLIQLVSEAEQLLATCSRGAGGAVAGAAVARVQRRGGLPRRLPHQRRQRRNGGLRSHGRRLHQRNLCDVQPLRSQRCRRGCVHAQQACRAGERGPGRCRRSILRRQQQIGGGGGGGRRHAVLPQAQSHQRGGAASNAGFPSRRWGLEFCMIAPLPRLLLGPHRRRRRLLLPAAAPAALAAVRSLPAALPLPPRGPTAAVLVVAVLLVVVAVAVPLPVPAAAAAVAPVLVPAVAVSLADMAAVAVARQAAALAAAAAAALAAAAPAVLPFWRAPLPAGAAAVAAAAPALPLSAAAAGASLSVARRPAQHQAAQCQGAEARSVAASRASHR